MLEDYQFMHFVVTSLYDISLGFDPDRYLCPEDSFPAGWEQLYQCPLLCRIVQAYILKDDWDWVDFHILLDISWDELRAAICTLRPFTGANPRKIVALLKCMARHLLSDASSRAISLELARGSIRLLNDIRTGQQPSRLWYEVFTQIKVRSLTSY
jgi:hypothetical protein